MRFASRLIKRARTASQLWASLLSLALSIVTGVKLSAIARMVGKETRDMATGNLDRGSARSVSGSAGDSADEAQEERLLAAAKQAFDQADSDSGGTLDRNEVRDLLTELGGEGMTRGDDNYFLEVFKRFDIDDSGALECVFRRCLLSTVSCLALRRTRTHWWCAPAKQSWSATIACGNLQPRGRRQQSFTAWFLHY